MPRTWLVEFPIGLLFALAGMIGAPIESQLANLIHEPLLLPLFAGLMLAIAIYVILRTNWHQSYATETI